MTQDDQAYAPVTWRYGQSKVGVPFARLRTEVGRHLFTVKVPADNELSCVEHETVVTDRDQMHAALVAMGYVPTVRIVKTRRHGWWGEVSLCLDDVTGLGVFLELEQLDPSGDSGLLVQAALVDLVAGLGIDELSPASRSRLALHERRPGRLTHVDGEDTSSHSQGEVEAPPRHGLPARRTQGNPGRHHLSGGGQATSNPASQRARPAPWGSLP